MVVANSIVDSRGWERHADGGDWLCICRDKVGGKAMQGRQRNASRKNPITAAEWKQPRGWGKNPSTVLASLLLRSEEHTSELQSQGNI